MEINNFLSIGIVGVALSGVIQLIKMKFGSSGIQTKVLTVTLALVVSAGYVFLSGTPYFQTVLGILATASTVYAFIVK